MLDEFSREMETTETKMDNVMKKMAKVLHMSSGTVFFFCFICRNSGNAHVTTDQLFSTFIDCKSLCFTSNLLFFRLLFLVF